LNTFWGIIMGLSIGERLMKRVHAAHRLGLAEGRGSPRHNTERLRARARLYGAPPCVVAAHAYGREGLPAFGIQGAT
jgi:hypothetical protein